MLYSVTGGAVDYSANNLYAFLQFELVYDNIMIDSTDNYRHYLLLSLM